MADVFTSIPVNTADHPNADIPPFNPPEEFKHLLAIHVFDNLYPGLADVAINQESTPVEIGPSKYRLVTPPGAPLGTTMGGAGEVWLPWKIDAEQLTVGPVPDPDIPDVPIDQMTPEQLAALSAKVEAAQLAHAHAQGMDEPPADDEPEFMKFRAAKLEQVEERLREAQSGPGEPFATPPVDDVEETPVYVFEPEPDDDSEV